MSDTDGKKPLGLGGGTGRSGQVKQSFSHGRTHNVAVEVKRKRVVVPGKTGPAAGGSRPGSPSAIGGDPSKRPAGISDAEMERRMAALRAAKAREVEEAAQREADEKAREDERERRRAEREAKEREDREREEALRLKSEEDERRARETELRAQKKAEVTKPKAGTETRTSPADRAAAEAAAARAETKGVTATTPRKTERERDTRGPADDRDNRNKNRDDSRRTGKLSLTQALDGEGGRQRSLAAMKRKQEKARQKAMGFSQRPEKQIREVQLPETILVSELANRMAERTPDVIKSLMRMGMMVTGNQAVDADTANW